MGEPADRSAWRVGALLVLLTTTGLTTGCMSSAKPRRFGELAHNSSPLARARAISLGEPLPDSVVIPRLIERLGDRDGVVRMAAHDELRQRTGQDFGFLAWAEVAQRDAAVERWKQWWAERTRAPSLRVIPSQQSKPEPRRGRFALFRRRGLFR